MSRMSGGHRLAACSQLLLVLAWLATASGCTGSSEPARSDTPDRVDAGQPSGPICGIDLQLWALEDEELVVPLACASGMALPRTELELEDAPLALTLDREAGELRWKPALDQAGDHTVKLRLGAAEVGTLRIGVAERFEHPENVPIVDPRAYAHELGLPVFHIEAGQGLNPDAHTPVHMVYEGREIPGTAAKYRGSTSINYPKRSFTFKFDKHAPFVDEARGFRGVRRLVLTTNFDDNSGLRQRLAFMLWNKLAQEHVQIRTFNAVVYLDGQYLGLYQVTDHVDDDLLREQGFPDGVNLYKARTHSANFRMTDDKGRPKTSLRAGYTKEAGLPEDGEPGAYADLESLVDWIANAPPDAFFEAYDARLLRRDFEDWLVFAHMINAGDTTNKNCYLIHDARHDAPDTRWRFVPWDFDVSYGQGFATKRLPANVLELDKLAKRNELFERQLTDPRLREPLLERYRDVLKGPWPLEEIVSTLDGWAAEIERAAQRDEVRWRETYLMYWATQRMDINRNTHVEEVAYIRRWLHERWSALEAGL